MLLILASGGITLAFCSGGACCDRLSSIDENRSGENIMKTPAKRAARKSPNKLQGAVDLAREHWQAAKKTAKRAKQAAKAARREFKDAKKVVKRAKDEMLAAARKLQSSLMSAAGRRKKPRAQAAAKKVAAPKKAGPKRAAPKKVATKKATPSALPKARAAARRPARPKPPPVEVVSTAAAEPTSPAPQETPTT
jgi:hypothetical protein